MNSNRGIAGAQPATIKPQDGTVLPVGELMERIIAAGDVSQLSPSDRAHYLVRVAESAGLNPLSQPFDLIPGPGGKLKLYPNKSATDQLRKIYRLNTITRSAQAINGTYVVTVEVSDGRRSESNIGAVTIEGLKGEALANALMKCHTKAKRRATLDWCGLGVLDEAEVGDLRDLGFVRPQADVEAVVVQDALSELDSGPVEWDDPTTDDRVADEATGEITARPLNLNDDIKRLRESLGWEASDVIDEARRHDPNIKLKTQEGKQRMVDVLQGYVDAVENDDGEAQQGILEHGSIFDAESRPSGEPGLDRNTA